jgi:hypothetical protein
VEVLVVLELVVVVEVALVACTAVATPNRVTM